MSSHFQRTVSSVRIGSGSQQLEADFLSGGATAASFFMLPTMVK